MLDPGRPLARVSLYLSLIFLTFQSAHSIEARLDALGLDQLDRKRSVQATSRLEEPSTHEHMRAIIAKANGDREVSEKLLLQALTLATLDGAKASILFDFAEIQSEVGAQEDAEKSLRKASQHIGNVP